MGIRKKSYGTKPSKWGVGMKYKLVFILMITILIYFSGCITINSNNSKVDYPKPGELEIILDLSNNTFHLNSSIISLNVKIKNISNRTIAISTHVKEKVGIYTYLRKNNITYLNSGNSANFKKDKTITLEKNESINFSYDIMSIGYLKYQNNEVGDPLEFPQVGKYTLYIEYKSHNYESLALSNSINFNILK